MKPQTPIILTAPSIHFVYPKTSRAEAYERVHHELIHRMLTSIVIQTMTSRCTDWFPNHRLVAVAVKAAKPHDIRTSTQHNHSRQVPAVSLHRRQVCEHVEHRNVHTTMNILTKKMANGQPNDRPHTAGMYPIDYCRSFLKDKKSKRNDFFHFLSHSTTWNSLGSGNPRKDVTRTQYFGSSSDSLDDEDDDNDNDNEQAISVSSRGRQRKISSKVRRFLRDS